MENVVNGLILKINLRNFLCHTNFSINFVKSNVHWVSGLNGSGKSAIVTALIVGLGGKAIATRRGANVQSFILKGAQSATIEITIKNDGPNAFNPDLYGNRIIVSRTIMTLGGSSYVIKSASGCIVSRRASDVNKIKQAHNIQVDNPVSVLTQDDARILSSVCPKKLYTFFKQATNLDAIHNNYTSVEENLKEAKKKKNEHERTLIDLQKELQSWEKKNEQLILHEQIRSDIKDLEDELVCSEIEEMRREESAIRSEIEEQTSECRELTEKLQSMNECGGNSYNVINDLTQQLQEFERVKTNLERKKGEEEGKFREAKEKYRRAQRATTLKKEELKKEERKIGELETEIANNESGLGERRRAEGSARASRAEDALSAARVREAAAEDALRTARECFEHAQEAADREADDEKAARSTLASCRSWLQQVSSRSDRGGGSLASLGTNMHELHRRVALAAQRGEFTAPPRGPVGHYLKLRDERWGSALEHIIGGSCKTFCVNSMADSRKLTAIITEVFQNGPKPTVFCSRFLPKRHNVSQRAVSAPPYLSALDALDVSDVVVANFLIDQMGLENVLLVPDHRTAMKLADTEEKVPPNCKRIVTEDRTEFLPAPNYRTYGPGRSDRRLGYLHADGARAAAEARRGVAAAEAAVREASRDGQRLARERARAAVAVADREFRAACAARLQCERDLRDAHHSLAQLVTPLNDELEKELIFSKQKVEKLRESIASLQEEEKGHTEKMNEIQLHMNEIKTELIETTRNCRELSEKIDTKQSEIDNQSVSRQNDEEILKEKRERLANTTKHLENVQVEHQQRMRGAPAIAVAQPRDCHVLKELLNEARVRLHVLNKLHLDAQQVRGEIENARYKYDELATQLREFEDLVQQLALAHRKRIHFCYELELEITQRVQFHFTTILSSRNYNGRIEVKHSEGTLNLKLTGHEDTGRSANSTAALSGGERSFGNVALLLALWQCVELPFYFLDEFNVFMDASNKMAIVKLLLEYTVSQPKRLFVLLSPDPPDASVTLIAPTLLQHNLQNPRP